MTNDITLNGPNQGFEDIKEVDETGIEFWTARKLFPLLGYSRWETFDEVIIRAAKAALNSGQNVDNHFRQLTKLVDIGSGGKVRQTIKDIGGDLPENLKPEKHIKEIKKAMKLLEKQAEKALLPKKKYEDNYL